jgi:Fur family ferric uptake transcriptional regulator
MKERGIDELVRGRLAERNIRYTGGRKALIKAVQLAGGPQSAAEIHKQVKRSVPISSLYRSLAILEEAGVLSLHHGQGKVARFELAEWLTGHHHHVMCIECGKVDDIELDEASEHLLQRLAAQAGGRAGYEESGHRLEIEGLCRRCR